MRRSIQSAFFALCAAQLAAAPAAAQSIFSNGITDGNPSAANPFTAGQVVDANLTVTGIGRGPGINPNAGSNRYNATAWSFPGFDANDYFTMTLTPNPGFEIDLVNFNYNAQRSGTGPNNFAFRSGLDGFTADIGAPTATTATLDLSGPAYQDVQGPIEFRFYGWAGTAAAGTFSINDFAFNGSVVPFNPVPEPASLVGLSGLVLGAVALRRRRQVA